MTEAAFVAELAARTAQYYGAISDSCIRHDEWGFYEEWEEAMANLVADPFSERFGPEFATLLNRCLGRLETS